MPESEKTNQRTESSDLGALILPVTDADSGRFINIVTRIIMSVAAVSGWPRVYTVHIDNWFGSRWLSFRGKIFGAAGVRNRTLKYGLSLPPFHPNRVLNVTCYHRQGNKRYSLT